MTSKTPAATPSLFNMPRSVLAAMLVASIVCLGNGCKKDDVEPPSTEMELEEVETSEEAQANQEDAENGADPSAPSAEEVEPEAEPTQVRQQVRSPSPDERAYNATEIRLIRERLGLIPPSPLEVDSLIRIADIRRITGYTGKLTKKPGVGTPPTANHNGLQYAAENAFGFGIEVWKYPSNEIADTRFEEYRTTLIAGAPLERFPVPASLSVFAGVRQLVFRATTGQTIVSVSCTETFCTTQHLREMASLIRARLL